ncbi:hypothetical protein [Sulfurimonas sp.]|uniref:hypothetical protein n=1 Tax=Sulfurimonas sp. TaxID=2022749 RepID=UPI0019EF08C6|nr:hypothetical protein [Sulfurimonas sp.]MBE0515305.1 hypothetical protein [Sulfurimonas sp.]
MIEINWDEFKFFKQYSEKKDDNFEVLLDFLKSYYSMTNIKEMYETMANDDIAQMMLNKREIHSVEELEKHLFRNFNVAK